MNTVVDPALAVYMRAVDAELRRRNKQRYEGSLHDFFKEFAWPIIEPRREFVDNWHLRAISEHLEAVTRREIKRLVINVPFRTSKSTLVSVAWPAWVWAQDPDFNPYAGPQHQWLCGSYAEKLAIRDSLKMRRLITHPDYQALWGARVKLDNSQNQKVRFQNHNNGYRIAFGMTGGVMGDGGDTLLIDDPHDRQGANSDAEREGALTTYDEALSTRLNDPMDGAQVIIMQRLHKKDLSGHVLAQGGWVHLMLPMEYEKERHCKTSIGFEDPRKEEGELLWPARFDRATVDKTKRVLGTYGAAGQLQQRPSPAGGGILRVSEFKLWPVKAPNPDIFFILQSYDTAFTEKTENDPTACTVWGIGEHVTVHGDKKTVKNFAILLDAWFDHMAYPKAREKLIEDWNAEYGGIKDDLSHPPRRPDVVLVEDKGSGISLLQDLRAAGVPVHGYNPGKADKIARAHMTAPLLESNDIYVFESRKESGKPVTWARPFISQCELFPNDDHDDFVDTFTQAMIYMRDTKLLKLEESPMEEVTEVDYVARRTARRNPYAS